MASGRAYLNEIARVLREEVPPALPVRVHQVQMPDPREYGDCSLVEKGKEPHFLIRLRKGMSNDLILFVLVHEWAHAVAWTAVRQNYIQDHDAEWGVAYARCWKAVSGCP